MRKNISRGQSLIEFTLLLPLLLLVVIGLLEVGIIFNFQITLAAAVREGAREAIIGGSNESIENTIKETASFLTEDNSTININPEDESSRISGTSVTISVTLQHHIITPLMGNIIGTGNPPSITLSSSTTMRME